ASIDQERRSFAGTLRMTAPTERRLIRPLIPEATDGLDALPAGGTERFAEGGDVHVDGAVEDRRVAAQRAVNDVVARGHATRAVGEEFEDAELRCRQRDPLAGVGDLVLGGVDEQLAAADDLRRLRRRTAAPQH